MHLTVHDLPTDDPRPLLLLDVDGVLNAINGSQNAKLYQIKVITTSGYFTVKVRLRRELNDWLFELTDHFVPVWCTMWNEEANDSLAPLLGLPDLPVLHCEYSLAGRIDKCHDKITWIETQVGDRAFAWVDDEITARDLNWATIRNEKVAPTKFMPIVETSGLQRYHVDRLIKWANSLKVVDVDD